MQEETGDAFGTWLREKMHEVGTNQRKLAEAIDVWPATVSNWMRGHRIPDPEYCERIADVLILDPDEVMVRAGHRRAVDRDTSADARELSRLVGELDPVEVGFVLRFVRFYLADRQRVPAKKAERIPDERARRALGDRATPPDRAG